MPNTHVSISNPVKVIVLGDYIYTSKPLTKETPVCK